MPTVLGRRCPKCGGPMTTEPNAGKPRDRRQSEVNLDTCKDEKCGWASHERLTPKSTAVEGTAPEDVPN